MELKDAFKHVELPESHEDAPDLPGISWKMLEALIALGYSSSEAQRMVDLAQPQLDQQYDLQELLKTALSKQPAKGERTWKRNG